jgi:membrane protein required for colicin V production
VNWLDYLLIALLAFSVVQSLRRGFTREIVSLIATVLAVVLGMWFYPRGAALVRPALLKLSIGSERAADFVGFVLVMCAVLLTGAIVGAIFKRFVKAVGLSFFDRLLGAGFGLVRGALIAIALLTAYIAFGPRGDAKTAPAGVLHSHIAPYLMKASRIFVDAAPAQLKRSFREVYDKATGDK